ncbi:class I SAM-dependent methyltransferase [Microbacterium murale]|uniref:SAM-dependent methyltransferase n=1 Tax=Microbacterium murale TaxID=1081040 RepID=A0ABU0PBE0_9MICO|nr:class I SAM-dependent methyltransferase [Microbacterium murale]MDQ0644262.1 SAM-dependent methyltransferase [Microbacterium murale]
MVDGADAGGWSHVAAGWAALWGSFADPARVAIMNATGIEPGTRVLDAGCGSGEFLQSLQERGALAVGADPAAEMVALARSVGVEVVMAGIEDLPLADDAFDVATAVNALQFADDTTVALRELGRVVRTDGYIAIANWAEGSLNDIDVVERAIADALDEEHASDGPLRTAGGIEAAFADAGLEVVEAGVVKTPWSVRDEEMLVQGILLGEDPDTIAELRSIVIAAAAPFRDDHEGFTLRNSFRWAVARVS